MVTAVFVVIPYEEHFDIDDIASYLYLPMLTMLGCFRQLVKIYCCHLTLASTAE